MGPRSHWKCLHQVRRHYTVADGLARASHLMLSSSNARAKLRELARVLGLARTADLGDAALGTPVACSKSSWVRRVRIASEDYYIKTYDYPTLRSRWRGALRNTGPLTSSRAAREADDLSWLRSRGFAGPKVAYWEEIRILGFLRRAILVTAAFPGQPLDAVLAVANTSDRAAIGSALGRFVARLHHCGFRDGNLDLRNLLLHDDRSILTVAKIDSPKFRVVRRGPSDDRLTRADWARLLPQLECLRMAGLVRAAAEEWAANSPESLDPRHRLGGRAE